MNLEEKWERAVKETEVVRVRIKQLLTFEHTEIPYIFLAPSSINIGDTIVRQGNVLVNKPAIIMPRNFAQFSGFEFEEDYQVNEDTVKTFLFVRGISFPSLKYRNETHTVNIYEGNLEKAIKYYSNELERQEDIETGLIVGPEDCWQFSVIILVCGIVNRCAPNDIKRLLDRFRK